MFFRAEWMHGERLVEVTKRLHHLERSDVTRRIPVADRIEQPELIAWRNHLGRWAVAAVELFAREVNKDEDIVLHGEEAIPGLAMALPWLDQWSLGPKRLVVDLPASEFSKSGWMRVWLLREGTPIWRQDLPWPGTGRKTVAGGDGEK
jgi:hypothetical protein